MQINQHIDLSGLRCPMPILRTKKALAKMQSGEILEVIATDPGVPKDFEAFSRQTGNELLSCTEIQDGVFCLVMKRK